MKIKGLIIFITTIFIVFVIYLSFLDRKVYYLVLGDYLNNNSNNSYTYLVKKQLVDENRLETYITEFQQDDARVTDLLNQIEDNKTISYKGKQKTLKNALIKADLVILSIGSNDLFYRLDNNPDLNEGLYDKADEILNDLDQLFELLKEYCKEDILFISFYNPYNSEYDELIAYMNDKLNKMTEKYGIYLVNITNCTTNNIKLSKKENICVYEKIKDQLKISLYERKFD